MNNKIKELLLVLESGKQNIDSIKAKLQVEYNKVFDDSKELTKVLQNAENASEYQMDQYGEIQSWYKWSGLSDYADCQEYFDAWLAENSCFTLDWENELILCYQGENLIIQDDTHYSRDNGVWLNNKRVIDETEYKEEDGEVNETRRNELIEAYMEKTGFFPGVFRVDHYGNVFLINTQKKAK